MVVDSRPISFGDLVVVFNDEERGFLASEGFGNVGVGLQLAQNEDTAQDLMDSVLEIRPAQSYEKLMAFKRVCEDKHIVYDNDLNMTIPSDAGEISEHLMKAPVLAERAANEDLMRRQRGRPVQFGHHVQFFHLKSAKYVSVEPSKLALGSGRANYVGVSEAHDGSLWQIVPRFKLNSDGQHLRANEAFVLRSLTAGLSLTVNPQHTIAQGTMEVFGSKLAKATDHNAFRLRLFRSHEQNADASGLFLGDTVCFYNMEIQSVLTVTDAGRPEFLETTRNAVRSVPGSMFIVEQALNTVGGPCMPNAGYHLLHLASGRYLATSENQRSVELDGSATYPLRLGDKEGAMLFRLQPLYGSEEALTQEDAFLLRAVAPDAYVTFLKTSEGCVALASSEYSLSHSLSCTKVPRAHANELYQLVASIDCIKEYIAAIEGGNVPSRELYRRTTMVLGDLVTLLTFESSDPHPLTRGGNVDKRYQDQLAERGVVELLVKVVRTPFEGLLAVERIAEGDPMFMVTALAFRLLRHCAKGSSENGLRLLGHLRFLEDQVGKGYHVEEALAEVLANEQVLSRLSRNELQSFVDRLREGYNPLHLKFLTSTMQYGDSGMVANQRVITNLLLSDGNEAIRGLKGVGDKIVMSWNGAEVDIADVLREDKNAHLEQFISASLDCLAACCFDRNESVTDLVRAYFDLDVLVKYVLRDDLPFPVRTGLMNLVLRAYVDAHPHTEKTAATTLVVWDDIQSGSVAKQRRSVKRDDGVKVAHLQAFDQLNRFVYEFVRANSVMDPQQPDRMVFTEAVCDVLKCSISYGWFSLGELRKLLPAMLALLDGRTDRNREVGASGLVRYTAECGSVVDAKVALLTAVHHAMALFTNQRIRTLLAHFKHDMEHSQAYKNHASNKAPPPPKPLSRARRKAVVDRMRAEWNVSEWNDQLLFAICSDLMCYDEAKLISLGVDTLLRFVRLRETVGEALSAMQVLVEDDPISVYNLSAQRTETLIELSKEGIAPHEEAQVREIVDDFAAASALSRQNQDILHNLRTHDVAVRVLRLLPENSTVWKNVYRFLVYLVKDHRRAQTDLHKHVDLFLSQSRMADNVPSLVAEIYRGNRNLCAVETPEMIGKILDLVRDFPAYYGVLGILVAPDGSALPQTQNLVLDLVLSRQGTPVVPDLAAPGLLDRLGEEGEALAVLRRDNPQVEPRRGGLVSSCENYVALLAQLSSGENNPIAVRVARLVSASVCTAVFCSRALPTGLRLAFLDFLTNASLAPGAVSSLFDDGNSGVFDVMRTIAAELRSAKAGHERHSSRPMVSKCLQWATAAFAHRYDDIRANAFKPEAGTSHVEAVTELVLAVVDVSELPTHGDEVHRLLAILYANELFSGAMPPLDEVVYERALGNVLGNDGDNGRRSVGGGGGGDEAGQSGKGGEGPDSLLLGHERANLGKKSSMWQRRTRRAMTLEDEGSAPSLESLVTRGLRDFAAMFNEHLCGGDGDGDGGDGDSSGGGGADEKGGDGVASARSIRKLTPLFAEEKGVQGDLRVKHLVESVKGSRIGSSVQTGFVLQVLAALTVPQGARGGGEDEEASAVRRAQERLHRLGATDMVLEMVGSFGRHSHLGAVLDVGIALLENGNKTIQFYLAQFFKTPESEPTLACISQLLRLSLGEVLDLRHYYSRVDHMREAEGGHVSDAVIQRACQPPPENACVTRLLRFVQLMCEGHYAPLQAILLTQPGNAREYNLLDGVVEYLAVLQHNAIDHNNIKRAVQCLSTITEVCQGPAKRNQLFVASGKLPSICNQLLRDPFDPPEFLLDWQKDELLDDEADLKSTVADTLMALLEGCRSPEVPENILRELELGVFRDILEEGYSDVFDSGTSVVSKLATLTRDVEVEGHPLAEMAFQCYFVLRQLMDFVPSVAGVLEEWKPQRVRGGDDAGEDGNGSDGGGLGGAIGGLKRGLSLDQLKLPGQADHTTFGEVLEFYEERCGRIEIQGEDEVQRVYFRIPDVCFQLTEESKEKVVWNIDRQSTSLKVQSLSEQFPSLEREMRHTMQLERAPPPWSWLFELRVHKRRLKQVVLLLALAVNFITLVSFGLEDKSLVDADGRVRPVSWDTLSDLRQGCFDNDDGFVEGVEYPVPIAFAPTSPPFDGSAVFESCGDWWEALDYGGAPITANGLRTVQVTIAYVIAVLQSLVFAVHGVQFFPLIILASRERWFAARFASGGGGGGGGGGSGSGDGGASRLSLWDSVRLNVSTTRALLADRPFFYGFVFVLFGWLAILDPKFLIVHLFVVVELSADLQNVFEAVTKNGTALVLTLVLGVVTCYVFAIFAFVFLRQDLTGNQDEIGSMVLCKSLFQCTVVSISLGPRKMDIGFGVDAAKSEWGGPGLYFFQFVYMVLMLVVLLNIIFGIIIDSFRELRNTRMTKLHDIQNVCPISGITREIYDKHASGFEHHLEKNQNMWHYLYFYVHLLEKDRNDYNGPESYVFHKLFHPKPDYSFYPIGTSLELAEFTGSKDRDQRALDHSVRMTAKHLRECVERREQNIREFDSSLKEFQASWEGLTQKRLDALRLASQR